MTGKQIYMAGCLTVFTSLEVWGLWLLRHGWPRLGFGISVMCIQPSLTVLYDIVRWWE